ncbi:MAG TPA: M14 family metallopeptidase [Candidatus Aminicenantes bacterium]|nr:M14 family metallopeptidase [Candidatus Aminicenantes bacterium]
MSENDHVRRLPRTALAGLALILVLAASGLTAAAAGLTSPKEQFGFAIGDDYQLFNYRQLVAYWKKLEAQSDRLSLVEIGRTAEGRTMVMAIVTSPANQARLARYKDVSKRLALARGLSDAGARKLAAEGKAVVWIDGGLHATEILGSQQLVELVWRLVSRDDAETRRILDDVILLAVPANPDGLDLVADWYMREKEPAKRSMSGVPVLYQKYIGHDNNRDFYMNTQPETKAMSRQLYIEWHPQILYNHHQTGPAGTVLFAPPFRDPFNYVFDPLIPVGLDLVSAAMHNRFVTEGKPGATMRSGAGYSTWWNGGLRSAGYFHNVIGILTETIGGPTPVEIPFIPDRLLPKQDYPYPVAPQKWHFRQSIEYAITADLAILDVASKHREDFLYRRYLMGKHAIELGSKDSWTIVPGTIAEVQAAVEKDRAAGQAQGGAAAARAQAQAPGAGPGGQGGFGRGGGVDIKYYQAMFDQAKRDSRGYIVPSDQADFPTATKFVNALLESGVEVERAKADFSVAGKSYPKGSYVIRTAQAFRPHVLTMFEPQDHPNDFPYPGGPPRPPYDAAGWTLAYQMGVAFDRVLDGFDGPFEKVLGVLEPPAGSFEPGMSPAGFVLDRRVNDAFTAVNRLVKAGEEVLWLKAGFEAGGRAYPAGAFYVPAKGGAAAVLEKAAGNLGLKVAGLASAPAVEAFRLKPVRLGLWDTYGGSMASGWVRWLLEQFEFPFELVFAPALDAGNLEGRFDAIIFVGGSIPRAPAAGLAGGGDFRGFQAAQPADVPDEYKDRVGRITAGKTIPALRAFVEAGGTILALDSATAIADHFGLPLTNALTEKAADGADTPLRPEKFYIPGSILRAVVDNTHPLAHGMPATVDVFFNNTPAWNLPPDAELKGVRPVAWFDDGKLLRSGWAWGESYLRRSVQVAEASVGKGKVFLYGPEVAFRGQPHGTFKLLFNGIYYGPASRN